MKSQDDITDVDDPRHPDYQLRWHWDPSKLPPPSPPIPPRPPLSVHDVDKLNKEETTRDRIERMLRPMSDVVRSCSMCSLGRKLCCDKESIFDPHCFSNMKVSRWMVVGQNPGFNEAIQGEPFIGPAGKAFARELSRHNLWRGAFYITNTVKCYTIGNEKPTQEHVAACEPILRMEINLLVPKLVITLGAVAFDIFCPNSAMRDHLGSIVRSNKFGVDVFPVYHPSPMNLADPERKKGFEEQMALLCKLVHSWHNQSGVPLPNPPEAVEGNNEGA